MIELIKILESNSDCTFQGYNTDVVINEVVPIDQLIETNQLAWCSDKNLNSYLYLKKGNLILSEISYTKMLGINKCAEINFIITQNPRLTFAKIIDEFFSKKTLYGFIADSAFIDKSVRYNKKSVFISHNVVIEENVVIGENVVIDSNTVIKANTVIHSKVKIGSNCTIGGMGFGYERNENGQYIPIQHIGNVVLNDGVEIGNNVCIDRAVIGSTIIGANVKIDNLVHIAHGVVIHENSLIIANAMIGGSTEIGSNVWVAPSSSLMQKIKIGDNSTIGLGAVILKDVAEGNTVIGNPGKILEKK